MKMQFLAGTRFVGINKKGFFFFFFFFFCNGCSRNPLLATWKPSLSAMFSQSSRVSTHSFALVYVFRQKRYGYTILTRALVPDVYLTKVNNILSTIGLRDGQPIQRYGL